MLSQGLHAVPSQAPQAPGDYITVFVGQWHTEMHAVDAPHRQFECSVSVVQIDVFNLLYFGLKQILNLISIIFVIKALG